MTPDEPPDADAREPASRRDVDRLGDLLPDQTRDDTANGWGDDDDADADADGRLRREVPPHHGG